MRDLKTFALLLVLLCGGTFAAFIQSPIPPSSRENFLYDTDKDGRLDLLSIKFLGTVSSEYLDQMVDSLVFDWTDSLGEISRGQVTSHEMKVHSESSRWIDVDLKSLQKRWLVQTSVKKVGNFRLFLKNGINYSIPVFDRMAPIVRSARLKIHARQEAGQDDTLNVYLSEPSLQKTSCPNFIEFKSGNRVGVLQSPEVLWNKDSTALMIVLNDLNRLTTRDSVRLRAGCVVDAAGNSSADSTPFVYVNGFYPLAFETGEMVVAKEGARGPMDAPVFQLLFESVDDDVPNENEWGVAMDLLTPEFCNAVRNTLSMSPQANLDYSKLQVRYNLKIYSNYGEFVVGTAAEVRGDDLRFENEAKRLFLKWNLMDGTHRRVGTGVYIANIAVAVTYEGKLVYRSDVHHGPTTRLFGVKRR